MSEQTGILSIVIIGMITVLVISVMLASINMMAEPTLIGIATPNQVLQGKTFYSDSTTLQTGTYIPHSFDGNITTNTILQGYSGYGDSNTLLEGTIPTLTLNNTTPSFNTGYYESNDLNTIDTDLTPTNIINGKTIFGVTGTTEPLPDGGWVAIPDSLYDGSYFDTYNFNIGSFDISNLTEPDGFLNMFSSSPYYNMIGNLYINRMYAYNQFGTGSELRISYNTHLTGLTLYETYLYEYGGASLITDFYIDNNPNLTSIYGDDLYFWYTIFQSSDAEVINTYYFNNNALDEITVEKILYEATLRTYVANFPVLYIDGGTNAVPNATSMSYISTLESNGWTVYYNI